MSATEAQLGLAPEFEFEFALKLDDRVRVQVSGSSFRVQTSGFEVRVPFRGSFSVPFRSIWVPIFGLFRDPRKDVKKTTLSNEQKTSIAGRIARGNAGLPPSAPIAESPSHSF